MPQHIKKCTSFYKKNSIECCSIFRDPSQWGHLLWNILHYITFTYTPIPKEYPKERKMQILEYKNFFEKIVPNILPCKKCSVNYKKHLTLIPIKLDTRQNFVRWFFNMHNQTNKILKKQSFPFAKFQQYAKSEHFYDDATNSFFHFVYFMQRNINCSPELNSHLNTFISFVFKALQ